MPLIDLWRFLDWLFYGLVRYVLWWVPVVQPFPVDRSPNAWWWQYNTYADWYHHLDAQNRPDEHWCRQWLEMTFGEFSRLVADVAIRWASSAVSTLASVVGHVLPSHASLGDWLYSVERRVGSVLPWFAGTVSRGLQYLFDLLPPSIRERWQSWDDLFRGIRDGAVALVRGLIDEARHWASEARQWVINQGRQVHDFYVDVQAFVRRLRDDPRGVLSEWMQGTLPWLVAFALSPVGVVLSLLGPDWQLWVSFAGGPAVFLYNLWAEYHDEIADLFADPRGWVYERIGAAMADRW